MTKYPLIRNVFTSYVYRFARNFILRFKPGRKSFSQFGEDLEISKWLPEESGRYIDIGSGEPIRGSNTFALYRKGWRGILVDGLPSNIRITKYLRPGDIRVLAIISNQTDYVKFWEFDAYEFSTINVAQARALLENKVARLKKISYLQAIPLSTLDVEMNPKDPTFLSIDVEGEDLNVLKSNNWTQIVPRVICVENLGKPSDLEESLEEYLQEKGYIKVKDLHLSCIFVHRLYYYLNRENEDTAREMSE